MTRWKIVFTIKNLHITCCTSNTLITIYPCHISFQFYILNKRNWFKKSIWRLWHLMIIVLSTNINIFHRLIDCYNLFIFSEYINYLIDHIEPQFLSKSCLLFLNSMKSNYSIRTLWRNRRTISRWRWVINLCCLHSIYNIS